MERRILRTRVYIDGYNFYYSCLKRSSLKWLDPLTLFQNHVLPGVQFTHDGTPISCVLLDDHPIHYFTAKILESVAKDGDSVPSQQRYHAALKRHHPNKILVKEGYYSPVRAYAKMVDDKNESLEPKHCREVRIWKVEEKQTDVNLALHAYHDAITKKVDQVVIVTNDTDVEPALKMIKENTEAIVGVVIPSRDGSRQANEDLLRLSDWATLDIPTNSFLASQFPRVIDPTSKSPTHKPISWYRNHEMVRESEELAKRARNGRGGAWKWLESPNEFFGGARPIDLLQSDPEGANFVLTYQHHYQLTAGNVGSK